MLVLSAIAHAQHAQLPADWPVGQVLKYQRKRHTQHFDGAYKKSDSTTVTDITITVLEKHPDGYTLRWAIGQTVYTDPVNSKNALATSVVNLMKGVTLDFLTDDRGRPRSLADKERAIGQIRGMIQNVTELLKSQGMGDQVIQQAVAGVRPLTDPARIETTVIQEPTIFGRMLGATLVLNESRRAESTVTNPFNGPPLPAIDTHSLTRLSVDAREAVVEWRTTLDDERAVASLHAMFAKWAQDHNRPIPRVQDLPRLKIEESTTYTMDTDSGWPKLIDQQRVAINGTRKTIEHMSFTRLPGEPSG